MEFTEVQGRSRVVSGVIRSSGETRGGQWSPEEVMGSQGGFVRSGGSRGGVRVSMEVIGGQERSGRSE